MIGRIRSVVQKLRGRSSHELYSRAAQRAFALGERASLRLRHDLRSQAPVFDPATVYSRPFFPGIAGDSANLKRTVGALRTHAPHNESDVIARATAAERGDISLFGRGVVSLGQSPDWQLDPFVGLRAPQQHWSTIPYLDRNIVGDHKVVWEISRHQYFVTFGQAFAYTNDSRWPKAFMRLVDSWLAGNPPTIGMNWCSSLEVSYRAISWLWALQLMRTSPVLDAEFKSRVLASLESHGRHLERYLSTYFSPNTHLTGEALGLFYIGTQCPELPRAQHWADLGASILERALDQQVLADGVYFEQATQYHRYTIDIYLQYWLLARQTGRTTAPKVETALHRMFDVLLHLTRADGTYPLIGDDDGGRLVQLDSKRPDDARALLATGAVLLNRSDLAWMGRGDDAALCWMLGADAPGVRNTLVSSAPAEIARAFTAGGVYTMRDGWGETSSLAVIDAGPHGALSYGHSHADPLAIDLTVAGHPLFVDAGTFTYVGDERNIFRSTASHNTVEVDGVGTSIPGTAFRWQKVSNAVATGWATEQGLSYFSGSEDGYHALNDSVQHTRSVLHNQAGIWIVRDVLASQGAHQAVARWHCAPGIDAELNAPAAGLSQVILRSGQQERATLVMSGPEAQSRIEAGWVSPQFGAKVQCSVCECHSHFRGNAVVVSIVIDRSRYRIGDASRVEVGGAHTVLLLDAVGSGNPGQTVLVVGENGPITFQSLTLEAEMALLTLDAATGSFSGLIGAGVTRALYDGEAFVPAGVASRWLSVSKDSGAAGGAWAVQSGSTTLPSPV